MNTERSDNQPQAHGWLGKTVAWTIFPALFGCSVAAALWGLNHGYSELTITLAISGTVAVILASMEALQTHAREWLVSRGDIPTDVAHLTFSSVAIPLIFHGVFYGGLMMAASQLVRSDGSGLWPDQWSLVGQLALALVIGEFCQYWWHRMAHERSGLWRFHATHHSSKRLYWLNANRFHPVDSMAQYCLEVSPLLLLGADHKVIMLFTLSTAVIGMFQHANIHIRLGVLNWIFSMTELHRWHHSRTDRKGNSNYGANLIVWDIVFGTRFLPKDEAHQPHDVGISGMPNFPQRYWAQMLSPFRWSSIEEEAGQRKPPNEGKPLASAGVQEPG